MSPIRKVQITRIPTTGGGSVKVPPHVIVFTPKPPKPPAPKPAPR
jgi:hypothetical protein